MSVQPLLTPWTADPDAFDQAAARVLIDVGWPRAQQAILRTQAESLVALMHAAWQRGHAALPLLPAAGGVVAVLVELGLASAGSAEDDPAPLRVERDASGTAVRLYPARTWRAEAQISRGLRERADEVLVEPDPSTAAATQALLGATPGVDQAAALQAALGGRLLVLAGGPGTGKTWLSARLLAALALAALRSGAARLPVVAAMAPTGKAAARFQESLRDALVDPTFQSALAAASDPAAAQRILAALFSVEAKTVHRALGLGGRNLRPEPLEADIVIVDEGSMVDLEGMAGILQSLAPQARLIVLGDTAQLSSVGAGTVFADLVSAGSVPGSPLAGNVTRLAKSRRFPPDSDLAAIAVAISELGDHPEPADVTRAVSALGCASADSKWTGGEPFGRSAVAQTLDRLATPYADLEPAVARARDACRAAERGSVGADVSALAALRVLIAAYRILTPYREGPFGVEHLNEELGRRFGECWQPVLITRNDYGTGLMNGDLGVRLGDAAWFAMADGPRRISTAWLPPHEPAWAMTIHKSQGSEYERIAVALPPREGQGRELATRELVFTGLTRARIPVNGRGLHLELYAAEEDLRAALSRRAARFGGLRSRLGA